MPRLLKIEPPTPAVRVAGAEQPAERDVEILDVHARRQDTRLLDRRDQAVEVEVGAVEEGADHVGQRLVEVVAGGDAVAQRDQGAEITGPRSPMMMPLVR